MAPKSKIFRYMELLRYAHNLSHAQYRLLTVALSYATGSTLGDIYPGNDALDRFAQVDPKTRRAGMRHLQDEGYLRLVKEGGKGVGPGGKDLANEYAAQIPAYLELIAAWDEQGNPTKRAPKHLAPALAHPEIDRAAAAFRDYGDASGLQMIIAGIIPPGDSLPTSTDAGSAREPFPETAESFPKARESLAPHPNSDPNNDPNILFHGQSADRPREFSEDEALRKICRDRIQELARTNPLHESFEYLQSKLTEALADYSGIDQGELNAFLEIGKGWDRPPKKVIGNPREAGTYLNKLIATIRKGEHL